MRTLRKGEKHVVMDLFCGGGGTSTGVMMALAALNVPDTDLELIAINHWSVAIDTHTRNHPRATHLCASLGEVADPAKLIRSRKDRRVKLLCASPECTHHSRARGGKPANDQSRASANLVLDFLDKLYVENLLVENVPEFMEWAPLGANGKPLKSKKGQLFEAWLQQLRVRGYRFEFKVLNCADYGAHTIRRRFFLIATRSNRIIKWPEPTHVAPKHKCRGALLFPDNRPSWRPAREILDLDVLGSEIFTERKKPLADKTMERIRTGARNYWGIDLDVAGIVRGNLVPFLVDLHGTGTVRSIDDPVQTIAAQGTHVGVVTPFLVDLHGQSTVASMAEPVRTVSAGGIHAGTVQGFLVPNFGEAARQQARTHSLNEPVPTATGRGCGNLAQMLLVQIDNHGSNGKCVSSAEEPMRTAITKQNLAVASPVLVEVNHGDGQDRRVADANAAPMRTVTGSLGTGLQQMVVEYYGTGDAQSADAPLGAMTTHDRFALVTLKRGEALDMSGLPVGAKVYRLLIYFRMLSQRECARAQSFPDDYVFTGTKKQQQVQIGNAVPPKMAAALACSLLSHLARPVIPVSEVAA